MTILTKNVTSKLTNPSNESPTGEGEQRRSRTSVSPWALMAVTCMLLGISGGVRFWRDLQFRSLAQESATCPFPLEDLPRVLKDWTADKASDSQLDPEIAKIAGSSDHIIRNYKNKKTGEEVTALVLYGLADSVFAHTPEICFPAVGYQQSKDSIDQPFSIPNSTTPGQYRSASFAKSVGGLGSYQEEDVYYTFLHNGEWLPALKGRWKSFRYHPAMFKIQLQYHASRLATEDRPAESLLCQLAQEIESRVSRNKTQVANVAPPH
jgi:Protein of unknown function (DUF3485)